MAHGLPTVGAHLGGSGCEDTPETGDFFKGTRRGCSDHPRRLLHFLKFLVYTHMKLLPPWQEQLNKCEFALFCSLKWAFRWLQQHGLKKGGLEFLLLVSALPVGKRSSSLPSWIRMMPRRSPPPDLSIPLLWGLKFYC